MIIHYMSNAGACNKSEKTKGMQIWVLRTAGDMCMIMYMIWLDIA